jgi:hypothetical protein
MFFPALIMSQVPPLDPLSESNLTEQQLENLTETADGQENEDDSYQVLLSHLQKNPLNINAADETSLSELGFLTPMQVQYFLQYRSLLGNLISIYELQAIPGWDSATIQKVRPYVAVSAKLDFRQNMRKMLSNGDHAVLLRFVQTLEKSKGYLVDPNAVTNSYPGSPQRLLLRYAYNYRNQVQYGFLAEKDPGEQLFRGGQGRGFDFYSAHLFVRKLGLIQALALGDFTVNLGQGLTQWMNMAFKKGADMSSIKRQSAVIRPYHSSGEILFHRGAGITLGRRKWQASLFGSFRKLDANFVSDSSLNDVDFVSSLQSSGLHRTQSELKDRATQGQMAVGGNISYRLGTLHLGINAIHYWMQHPIMKSNEPYNFYALSGSNFGNYSIDYAYTYKNLHLFGELAQTNKKAPALVSGLIVCLANNVDLSLVYRGISSRYQSLYSNAFTENTNPSNENGIFTGISIRPHKNWRIDAYSDFYRFDWLKYRVNAPTRGTDFMILLNYRPSKQFELYTRFKMESKAINVNTAVQTIGQVMNQPKKNWRTHFSYKLNNRYTVRSRVELLWFNQGGAGAEQGFLIFTDLLYKPMMKPFSGNLRLQYFETEGYNSRLYAYENDVQYSFSVPFFYEKGYRLYANAHYKFSNKWALWAKLGRSIYPQKIGISSGLDEIAKHHKTELKWQLLYQF